MVLAFPFRVYEHGLSGPVKQPRTLPSQELVGHGMSCVLIEISKVELRDVRLMQSPRKGVQVPFSVAHFIHTQQ